LPSTAETNAKRTLAPVFPIQPSKGCGTCPPGIIKLVSFRYPAERHITQKSGMPKISANPWADCTGCPASRHCLSPCFFFDLSTRLTDRRGGRREGGRIARAILSHVVICSCAHCASLYSLLSLYVFRGG
jgi:hypothetical protein